MKYILLFFTGLLFISNNSNAQSDGCSAATTISVTANCSAPTAGTTVGATQTIPGCVGTADDDVWYKFVATSTSHQIDVVGAGGFDAVVQLFSGSCSSLVSLTCQDQTLGGGTETIYANNLTIGNTYTIRVYDYYSGSPGNFTICVTEGPTPPSNDFCSNAIPLAVNAACVYTAGSSLGATQTMTGCAGTADDDVWFSFVATNSVQTITVDPSSNMDPVVQLLDGACVTFNSLYCVDDGFTNGNEVINAVGLTPGTTYYVRVYDYYSGNGGDAFDICITGTATAAPTNDEPCNAIALPPVTSACEYLDFTTTLATASLGAPTPSSCVGGSAPQEGGFNASTADVWFTITVPATGVIEVMPDPASGLNDMVFSLYSGTCGALTQIACSDDYSYPYTGTSTPNGWKPKIYETGLNPGDVLFLRVWGYGSAQGDFGICVNSPTNDDCANALYICDINGYSASTSSSFTEDRPDNMFANNELADGTPQANGINTGGIFGGSTYDVEINNNSWIRFTASATTATLNVDVYDCWKDPFPSGGIQMEVFEGTNCTNFVSVSNFEENSTGFVITATGLTVGQDYYLMVDGYAGDICSYTITANTGVQFPEITAAPQTICVNSSTTLTAPSGATSYSWYPGGQTTQAITVSPSTTTTYYCIVEGVCGYKQTLTKTITVNQEPTMTSSGTASDICSGNSVNHALTSDLSSTYSWVATSNANVTGESTSAQSGSTISDVLTNATTSTQTVTYTVTPTSSQGCTGPNQTVTVTVNPKPTMTSASSQTICSGDNVNIPLTSNVSSNYSWVATSNTNVTGESTSPQLTSTINDGLTNATTSVQTVTYNVTPTSTTGSCAGNAQTVTVTVNPTPTMTSASSQTICSGNNVNIPLTSNVSSTYSWVATDNANTSGESTSAQTTSTINDGITNNSSSTQNVTYTVTPTSTTGSCAGNDQTVTVTVNSKPTMTSANTASICSGGTVSINLTSDIASNYSWVAADNANTSGESTTAQSGSPLSNTITNNSATAQDVIYTVTPTSTAGACLGNDQTVTVTVNPMDDASFSYTPTTFCLSGTDPTPTVTGLAGGTFTINNGGTINAADGTIDLSASGVGPYTVTYSTSGACPNSSTAPVTITSAPDATFNYGGASTFCQTGTATISHPAGASDGTYSATPAGLSLNATTGEIDLANSSPGTYTITNDIAAGGGCAAATYDFAVTVNQNPAMTSGTSQIICSGDNVNIPLTSDIASTYSWIATDNVNTSGESTSAQTTSTINDGISNTSGSAQDVIYTVTPTSTSGSCQGADQTVTVTVNPAPIMTSTASQTICSGDNVNIPLTSDVASNYSWVALDNTNVGGESTSIQTTSTIDDGLTNTSGSAQNVTYTVTPTSTSGSCQGADQTVTITVNPAPVMTNGNTTSVCSETALNFSLTSDVASTYAWVAADNANTTGESTSAQFGNAITDVITNNGTSAESVTYTVTPTSTSGTCQGADQTVTVTVNPLDDASFSYTSGTFCASGTNPTPTVSGLTGGTFSIDNGGVINAGDGTIDLAASGPSGTSYTVTYTTNGVCPNSSTASITITTAPDATFDYNGVNDFCQVGTASVTHPAGASDGDYTFTPAGLSIDALTGQIDLAGSADGTYTITNTIDLPGCAIATDDEIITINPPDNDGFTYGATAFCTSDANPIPTVDVPGGTFTATGGLVFVDANPTSSTGEIDIASTGSGTFDVTYTTNGTCINDSTISITISGQLDATITASSTSFCDDDAVVTFTGADAGGTWSGNGVDPSTGDFDPTTAGPGSHWLYYTLSGSCGDIDSVEVTVNETPDVSVTGDTICDGSAPTLVATGSGGTIEWYDDASLTNLVNTGATYSPVLSEGIYTFYVIESNNGCSGAVASADANVFDLNASFTATPLSGDVPLNVSFVNTSTVVDTLNDSFYWDFGNGSNSSDFEPSVTYTTPGTFTTILTVTNEENMCTDTATVDIEINGELQITFPNIFTPNGDEQNDVYTFISSNAQDLKATIFDRWGLLIYQWRGIQGGWDGKTKAGIDASEGTYYYFVEVTDYQGEVHMFHGPFNLNR